MPWRHRQKRKRAREIEENAAVAIERSDGLSAQGFVLVGEGYREGEGGRSLYIGKWRLRIKGVFGKGQVT